MGARKDTKDLEKLGLVCINCGSIITADDIDRCPHCGEEPYVNVLVASKKPRRVSTMYLLGSEDCGVVCSLPSAVRAGSVVRISNSIVITVIGGGSLMLGHTYRLISSPNKYSLDGEWIPVFGVQTTED